MNDENKSTLTENKKPKKYFTLSFDDGITQDLKIIEILKKYNVNCISFNVNTGLCGVSWDWVGPRIGHPEVRHDRLTQEQLESGIYKDYDVCVHTLHHPSLKQHDNNVAALREEVVGDAENICAFTGSMPVGMAWPGGDNEYTETTIRLILENTGIRFARGILSTHTYQLPTYFMQWQPTCSLCDPAVLELADAFVKAECTEDMIFYVWGHGYELDAFDLYGKLDALIEKMVNAGDVELVTNTEFYHLFKDKIPSWKEA